MISDLHVASDTLYIKKQVNRRRKVPKICLVYNL